MSLEALRIFGILSQRIFDFDSVLDILIKMLSKMEQFMEDLDMDLWRWLREATVDQLRALEKSLLIQKVDKTGRKPRQIRIIRAEVDGKLDEMSVEEGIEYLKEVLEAAAVVLGEA